MESDWVILLLSLKFEIRIVFTPATPPINSFCKNSWLKGVDVCQKANCQFEQTFFILRRITRGVFGRIWRREFFYHKIFYLSQSQHLLVRVSRASHKKSFAIKLFQFCDSKTQQCYILQEEVNISKRELTFLVDSLRDLLKTFDHACKCIQIPLQRPKSEIGSTKSKNNLVAHYNNDIIEHQ